MNPNSLPTSAPVRRAPRPGPRQWVAAAAFLLLAGWLSIEHRAHLLALLPLSLALACPLMHVLHHRRGHRRRMPPPGDGR